MLLILLTIILLTNNSNSSRDRMSFNSKCTATFKCHKAIQWLWLTSFFKVWISPDKQVQILYKTWCSKCSLECRWPLLSHSPNSLLKHNLRPELKLKPQRILKELLQQLQAQARKGHKSRSIWVIVQVEPPEDNQLLKSQSHKQRPLQTLKLLRVKHDSLLLLLVEHKRQHKEQALMLMWSNYLIKRFTNSAPFAIVCKETILSSRVRPCLNSPSTGILFISWVHTLQTCRLHFRDSCRICSGAVIWCSVRVSSLMKLTEGKLQKWQS